MLFDPRYLLQSPVLVAGTLGVIILGKSLAALAIVLLLGYSLRVGLSVAVALAQIGEFSFILAALGRQLRVLPDSATDALVVAAIVSISLNPVLYRQIDPIEAWMKRRSGVVRWVGALAGARSKGERDLHPEGQPAPRHEAIVVGYGPVGRTVVRLLRENGVEPTVIELNLDTVRNLRVEGIGAVYGDATHWETLKQAGVERAVALILSSSGMGASAEVIRQAREANPRIRVVARVGYLREVPALRRAGADAVFSGEGEVALTMTEFILREVGATAEQIDRERDRIRTELFSREPFPEP